MASMPFVTRLRSCDCCHGYCSAFVRVRYSTGISQQIYKSGLFTECVYLLTPLNAEPISTRSALAVQMSSTTLGRGGGRREGKGGGGEGFVRTRH